MLHTTWETCGVNNYFYIFTHMEGRRLRPHSLSSLGESETFAAHVSFGVVLPIVYEVTIQGQISFSFLYKIAHEKSLPCFCMLIIQ